MCRQWSGLRGIVGPDNDYTDAEGPQVAGQGRAPRGEQRKNRGEGGGLTRPDSPCIMAFIFLVPRLARAGSKIDARFINLILPHFSPVAVRLGSARLGALDVARGPVARITSGRGQAGLFFCLLVVSWAQCVLVVRGSEYGGGGLFFAACSGPAPDERERRPRSR